MRGLMLMRTILAMMFMALVTQASAETDNGPSWTQVKKPYEVGDILFCESELDVSKSHTSHELLELAPYQKLNLKIYDEKTIVFGTDGILSGQAMIISRWDFGFNARQWSSETEIYLNKKYLTLIINGPKQVNIHSLHCEMF